MHCYAARQQFSDYYDGALPEADMPRLELHLGGCASCRFDYACFEQSLEALGLLEPEDVLVLEARADVDEKIGGGGAPPYELASSSLAANAKIPPVETAGGARDSLGVTQRVGLGSTLSARPTEPRSALPLQPASPRPSRSGSFVARVARQVRLVEERSPGLVIGAAVAIFVSGVTVGLVSSWLQKRSRTDLVAHETTPEDLQRQPPTTASAAHHSGDSATPQEKPTASRRRAPHVPASPSPTPVTAASEPKAEKPSPQQKIDQAPPGATAPALTGPSLVEIPEEPQWLQPDEAQPRAAPDVIRANREPAPNEDDSEPRPPPPSAATTTAPIPTPASPEDDRLPKQLAAILGDLEIHSTWQSGGLEITHLMSSDTGTATALPPTPDPDLLIGLSNRASQMKAHEYPIPRYSRLVVESRTEKPVLVIGGEVFLRGQVDRAVATDGLAHAGESVEVLSLALAGLAGNAKNLLQPPDARQAPPDPLPLGVLLPTRARALLLAGQPPHVVEEALQSALMSSRSTSGNTSRGGLPKTLAEVQRQCLDRKTRRIVEQRMSWFLGQPRLRGVAISIRGQLRSMDIFGSHADLCASLSLLLRSAMVEQNLERAAKDIEEKSARASTALIAEQVRSSLQRARDERWLLATPRMASSAREARTASPTGERGYALINAEGSDERPQGIVHIALFPTLK